MSESKSPNGGDADGIDELAALREAHVRSAASAIDSLGRARDRLDDESKLRSSIRRERRRRVAEMGERVEGMRGALRKANDILFEEELHRIEADMRAELEVEMERLETEALEREERLLREEMLHRLRREENRLREQLDLERDRRIEGHTGKLRERLKTEMETEFSRRKAFLADRLELEASQDLDRMQRRVEMDIREAEESKVHRKVEAHRLAQEIAMREKLAASRKKHEAELEKQLAAESKSLEKEMISDVDVRLKSLGEEAEAGMLAELDRWFRAERETMETALHLKRQELALEREVEMEQRLADSRKQREVELSTKLEEQFAKKAELSKKEIEEMLKSLENELKVKWEAILIEARQSAFERSNGN
mgnify:FL=1